MLGYPICFEWWEFILFLVFYVLIGQPLGMWIWMGTRRWIRRILDAISTT